MNSKKLATVISDQIANFKRASSENEVIQNRERKMPSTKTIVSAKISIADVKWAVRILSSNCSILDNNEITKIERKTSKCSSRKMTTPST